MKLLFFVLILPFFSFTITPQEAVLLGDKIWKNECRGTLDGLLHWNVGEEFLSLGIGHFIWYPEGYQGPFEETFPALLQFLEKESVDLPDWLRKKTAPWVNRKEFLDKKDAEEAVFLRKMLFETRGLQALFIAKRLETAISQIDEKNPAYKNLQKFLKDPKGLYALIDYANFKGTGLRASEAYQNQGWGLIQVLEGIPDSSTNLLADFVKESKRLLQKRVENAPKERGEERWLKGWFNRLDTYLE